MAYGTEIIVSSPPRGLFREGLIKTGETPKPGTVLQIDASAGLASGTNNWTYEIYNADADGGRPKGPLFILLIDCKVSLRPMLTLPVITASSTPPLLVKSLICSSRTLRVLVMTTLLVKCLLSMTRPVSSLQLRVVPSRNHLCLLKLLPTPWLIRWPT